MAKKRKIVDVDGSSQEVVDAMVDAKTCSATKKMYASRIVAIQSFCEKHHPTALDSSGKLVIPLQGVAIETFFGELFKNAHAREKLKSPQEIDLELHPEPYNISTIDGE